LKLGVLCPAYVISKPKSEKSIRICKPAFSPRFQTGADSELALSDRLADAAVKEPRDRVTTALTNSGFKFPMGRSTINMSDFTGLRCIRSCGFATSAPLRGHSLLHPRFVCGFRGLRSRLNPPPIFLKVFLDNP
jgi:hypothetical protein